MNIFKKIKLLLILVPIIFLHSCTKDSRLEPTEALSSHLILLNSSFEANIDTLKVDSTLTVIDNEAVADIFPISQSNKISLDVVAPASHVIAVGLRFGTSRTIHFSYVPDIYFALSGNICEDISPICHRLKIYEYGLTSTGKISLPKEQDAVIICGNCCDASDKTPSIGQDGNPRFNLRFSQGAALHLYVEGPDTTEIKDVSWTCLDCNIGANENIFWENGPSGEYKFYVKYEDYCVSNISSRFVVTVSDGGKEVITQTGTLQYNSQSPTWTYNKP